jgi:sulfoxide reductase catalytic subunit YedY
LSSEITPQIAYAQRRDWLKQMAAGAAGLSMAAWASRDAFAQAPSEAVVRPGKLAQLTGAVSRVSGANTMEKITTYADASSYNNFYEFGTDKSDPAKYAHTLQIKPWTVEVEGLVKKPGRFDLDALLKLSPMEERIYRLRCVEGWSSRGWAIHWPNSSSVWSLWVAPSMLSSSPKPIPKPCLACVRACWIGRTWKAFAWTKQYTHSRS